MSTKKAMLVGRMPNLIVMPRTGRYNYPDAAYEIERWCSVERGRKKRLAAALGLDQTLISPRLRGSGKAKFSIEQIGVVADEAGAPTGWPFVTWERAAAADPTFNGPATLPWPKRR